MRKTPRFLPARRSFAADDGGNVLMTLALAALPMLACVSAAVDYASITNDITKFKAASDSALLAVVGSSRAKLTGLTDTQKAARLAELQAYARTYLAQNFKQRDGAAPIPTPVLTIDGQTVRMTVSYQVHAPMLSVFGLYEPTVKVDSTVKKAAAPVELVMVMDTTGSMGTTYMDQAKTAARNLLTKVYGGDAATVKDNENVRVALVPFSGAVRLNTAASDFSLGWIDTTGAAAVSKLNFADSTWNNYRAWTQLTGRPWNGCVEARAGVYKTDDTPPVSGDTLFTPYFAPDEPTFSGSSNSPYNYLNSYIGTSGTPNETTGLSNSVLNTINDTNNLVRQNNQAKYAGRSITAESSSDYGPWFNCAKSAIVPMTYDRSKVEAGINAMTAAGSTVIPEGLAWGWRVLSPGAPFTKVEAGPTQAANTIAPYRDPKWNKVMVLMTDGENDVLSGGNQVNTLNGTWYSSYGRGKAATGNRFGTTSASGWNAALDSNMLTLCANIKAQGITLYTVAFRVTSTTIQNNLKNCATSAAHYSFAADGVALGTIFNHIGENVTNTQITLVK